MIQYIIHLLSNDNLSTLENFIIWINFFFSSGAAWFAYKASKEGLFGMRNTFKFISAFAILYSIAYLILLLFDVNFLSWSAVMRGVSIGVWGIVWIAPAVVSVKLWKQITKSVSNSIAETEE